MNILGLSDAELIDYLDKFSDDLVIRRLVDMHYNIDSEAKSLISDLVLAGMDKTYYTFDFNDTPGEYIRNLERNVEDLQDEVDDLRERLDELKTKTIVDMIYEIKISNDNLKKQLYEYERNNGVLKDKLKDMEEQRDAWAILNKT